MKSYEIEVEAMAKEMSTNGRWKAEIQSYDSITEFEYTQETIILLFINHWVYCEIMATERFQC